MKSELQILEEINHAHIMRIYELLHDDRFYYIVSEYLKQGELYQYIVARIKSPQGPMIELEVQNVTKQLFYCLCYLHSNSIIHRDLKPENILINKIDDGHNIQIKVSDFGFAHMYKNKELKQCLGTPIYMAPEVTQKKSYDFRADVWSSTIIVFIMLTGK